MNNIFAQVVNRQLTGKQKKALSNIRRARKERAPKTQDSAFLRILSDIAEKTQVDGTKNR